MSTFDERVSLAEAEPFMEQAVAMFEQTVPSLVHDGHVQAFPMGSFRRAEHGEPTDIGDLDLLVTCSQSDVVHAMTDLTLHSSLTVTAKKAHGWLHRQSVERGGDWRMKVDGWWCPWESIGPFAMFLTGPGQWNVWMRQVTNRDRPDLMLTQYGLFTAVKKPTKTYPDRKVVGERVDVIDEGASVEEAERLFWDQWCHYVGRPDAPFRKPHERRLR